MASATTISTTRTTASHTVAESTIGRTWNIGLFHALAIAGAIAVIAGSYMTWASFYAGLISRNGVPGHGKYFIGLAVATIALALLSMIRGVSPALRWLVLPAAATIAAFALRDLYNLNALIHDPNAGFYLPGRGNGLYVVIAGAVLMASSVFASASFPRLRPFDASRTLAAMICMAGIAMIVPAVYGEYYIHASSAHLHDGGVFNTTHLLTVAGPLALLLSARIGIMGMDPGRRSRDGSR